MSFRTSYLVFFTLFNFYIKVSFSDTLKKGTSSLRGGNQSHYHDINYSTENQSLHSLRKLQQQKTEACPLPINTIQFSLITKQDARVAAHGIYKGMAIGGQLYDPFPRNSKTVDGKAYVGSLSKKEGYNFNKGIEKNVLLSNVVDFAYFEWLAQNAQSNWYNGDYKVVVLTKGGTYNTYNFRNGGQGEDNGKTLVIFNTNEKVTLTKTPDGRQFGPSVIAPFSTVDLSGNAGFVDGFIVAKSFVSSGGGKATQLQMHGDTYKGPIRCNAPRSTLTPTKAHTNLPTSSPTNPPTSSPTNPPTNLPTSSPTNSPTSSPFNPPTNFLTSNPTNQFAYSKTNSPTNVSTSTQTIPPTLSHTKSSIPPTGKPTKKDIDKYNAAESKEDSEDKATSGARGDPHIMTWSGERYDFHGVCDLVLLHNPDFENGLGMYVHMRTTKTRQWSQVSAAVVKIGSDILEVSGDRKQNLYWINKVQGMEQIPRIFVDPNSGATLLPETLSGYSIKFQKVSDKQRKFIVDLRENSEGRGYGEKIVIKTWHGMIRLDVVGHSIKNFGSSLGLMGSFGNGLKLARDGQYVINNTNDFGQEWQVSSSDSKLFHVADGPQAPVKCEIPSRTELRRSLAESEVTRELAETVCAKVTNKGDFDMCIFDVMVTSDQNIAGAY